MECLRLISLFCGPGGLDQGFKEAGFETLLAYDIDQPSVRTHRRNHPEAKALVADLSKITPTEMASEWQRRSDVGPAGVIGGPPCQSFSVSNVHQTDDDPRHELPEHYARILTGLNEAFGIDFFVFENVPGLVNQKHLSRFECFKRMFEKAGFTIAEGSLNALDFGAPQDRPRVFVVGVNKQKYPGLSFRFPSPAVAKAKTVREAIGGLPEPTYYARGLSGGSIHPNHWCMVPRSRKFSNDTLKPGEVWGRSFRVLSWDEPSYTVAYGHREVHIHPSGKRRLSVYEAMLLQGFPKDDYVLEGTLSDQIRMVSEAVSPPVARALAAEIRAQLHRGGNMQKEASGH